MRHAASVFVVVSCLAAVAVAQTPQRAPAGFDVASVRRNTSADSGSASAQPGGGFTATNLSLRQLVAAAHSLPLSRVVGGPDWVDSERYDIVAKGGDQANEMRSLQALLRDRFALVVRTERRSFPVTISSQRRQTGDLAPGSGPRALTAGMRRLVPLQQRRPGVGRLRVGSSSDQDAFSLAERLLTRSSAIWGPAGPS
jgi:hypothetical protein